MQLMICGIIDMGANTIRMSIYRVENHEFRLLIHKKATAELSSYVKKDVLSQAGMEKACEVLQEFRGILENFGIEELYVFATASLRNIDNTQEAVAFIREQTGIAVDVLSGEDEARLDFIGASRASQISDGVLVDIGGGSTEIVEFQNGLILSASSLPVGCLTLYLKYVKEVFPRDGQYREIRRDVQSRLCDTVSLRSPGCDTLYGVGGTVRTALRVSNLIFDRPQNNRELSYENLKQILKMFRESDRFTLKTILQTDPDRVHSLIPGLIVLKAVAKYCGSTRIIANNFGVREGYLYDRVPGGAFQ